ncbi:hypothetical protein AYO21_04248 [Fonsecaea monophora]|uniref:Uncharacterized protein n=1 Tax=Fonsecaea monophora TaxID=254056 RepID=A0A177FCN7_9EURO|nr:hypothetical protein AYO21_04248 [Fonsecaea monophora]OAG41546.1 hypothetical protein AYO21_04248 [Fonsecaea monophora]
MAKTNTRWVRKAKGKIEPDDRMEKTLFGVTQADRVAVSQLPRLVAVSQCATRLGTEEQVLMTIPTLNHTFAPQTAIARVTHGVHAAHPCEVQLTVARAELSLVCQPVGKHVTVYDSDLQQQQQQPE